MQEFLEQGCCNELQHFILVRTLGKPTSRLLQDFVPQRISMVAQRGDDGRYLFASFNAQVALGFLFEDAIGVHRCRTPLSRPKPRRV